MLKACIYKSYYGYYGGKWSYGLGWTNEQKQAKLWKNFKIFRGEVRKIFGGQHLDETRRKINKFYNCYSQGAANQFSF